MKPILQIDIELTPEQVKKLENATKILTMMAKKNKPGALIAQVFYTGNEFTTINKVMNFTPRIKCYVIPAYLMKRLIRIMGRASNPANKIPRRKYWKAAATGILKYIQGSEVKRKPFPHINEENSMKPFGGRFENTEIEDDIPF